MPYTGNVLSGGLAGAFSLAFVYSLDYARTRLGNDAKNKDGQRQFSGLYDVYAKTLATDGIAGLYRGFNISCLGIIVYRGLYFGVYDSLKPVLLQVGNQLAALLPFVTTVGLKLNLQLRKEASCSCGCIEVVLGAILEIPFPVQRPAVLGFCAARLTW